MTGLAGKNVLIVGASSGIGKAVAKRFAAKGARVLVHFNSSADGAQATVDEIKERGGFAETIAADVANPNAAATLVDEAIGRLGGLDVLINNAGSMLGRVPVSELSEEQYHAVLDLNVGSVLFASRQAARYFRSNAKSGTIINTTSIAARTGGAGGAGIYGSAKAFVSTITRAMAKELADVGVRVNAVAPGVIITPFHDRVSTAEQLAAMAATIPMKRLGTAEECVGAYEFLADETMSSYVTGQIIEVNGGQLMP